MKEIQRDLQQFWLVLELEPASDQQLWLVPLLGPWLKQQLGVLSRVGSGDELELEHQLLHGFYLGDHRS